MKTFEHVCLECPLLFCDEGNPGCEYRKLVRRHWRKLQKDRESRMTPEEKKEYRQRRLAIERKYLKKKNPHWYQARPEVLPDPDPKAKAKKKRFSRSYWTKRYDPRNPNAKKFRKKLKRRRETLAKAG